LAGGAALARGLVSNTPQIIAHGSIHYIKVTEPDLIVAAASSTRVILPVDG
jgi:hypothetical protein